MANRRPLVLNSGEIQQIRSPDLLIDPYDEPYDHNQLCTISQTVAIGNACCFVGGLFSGLPVTDLAKADASTTAFAVCLAAMSMSLGAGTSAIFQFYGIMSGLSGLSVGPYFLSATTAGAMTPTPPSTAGQYIVKLGFAISSTKFFINIQRPILLS